MLYEDKCPTRRFVSQEGPEYSPVAKAVAFCYRPELLVEEDDVELHQLIPMEMNSSEPIGIRWQCLNYNSQGITIITMTSKSGV